MIGAFLTSLLFAGNAVLARRSALLLGSTRGNFWRLLLAVVLLGAWTFSLGRGTGAAFVWFFVSGLAGFGLGGLLMFHALPRAGSNVANLIVQCGSAIVALVVEWAWLSSRLNAKQLACVAVILGGVVFGLAPRGFPQIPWPQLRIGAILAALSAVGQGAGAVLSRKAFATARGLGVAVDPGTAAFERALGGLLIASVALVAVQLLCSATEPANKQTGRAWPWVLANTLAGPVLGVTCMQWALSTTHAAIVQSIVAAAPLLTAPFAWRLGETFPRMRYFIGAALAVAATGALWLVR